MFVSGLSVAGACESVSVRLVSVSVSGLSVAGACESVSVRLVCLCRVCQCQVPASLSVSGGCISVGFVWKCQSV